jgi:hypothetical protein
MFEWVIIITAWKPTERITYRENLKKAQYLGLDDSLNHALHRPTVSC